MSSLTLDLFDSEVANELLNGNWLPKMSITRSSGSVMQINTSAIRRHVLEYTVIPDEIPTEAELLPFSSLSLYRISQGCDTALQHLNSHSSIENDFLKLKITRYQGTINSTIITKVYRSFWHAAPLEYLSSATEREIVISALSKAKIIREPTFESYLCRMANFFVLIPVPKRCTKKKKFAKIHLLPFLPFDTATLLLQMPLKNSLIEKCLDIWFHSYFYVPGHVIGWDRKLMQRYKFTKMKSEHFVFIQENRKLYPCQDTAATWDIDHMIALIGQVIKKRESETEAEIKESATFITADTSYLEAGNLIGFNQLAIILKRKFLDRNERERLANKKCCRLSTCWSAFKELFKCKTNIAIHPDPNVRSVPVRREHQPDHQMSAIKTIA